MPQYKNPYIESTSAADEIEVQIYSAVSIGRAGWCGATKTPARCYGELIAETWAGDDEMTRDGRSIGEWCGCLSFGGNALAEN
jgi:hypothetical protein